MSRDRSPRKTYGVVGVSVREGRLLVIRRSRHVRAPRAYCFPGGGIEPQETPAEALVRELDEELGVTATPGPVLWESVTDWGVRLVWMAALLPDEAVLTPNPREVESIHWFFPAEIRDLDNLLTSNYAFLDALEAGVFRLD